MHESVIALGIVREIDKALKKSGKPLKITVSLGELQNVNEDVLDSYIKLYLEEEKIADVRYEFTRESARFKCSVCGRVWYLSDVNLSEGERESIHFLPESIYTIVKCPGCGSNVYEIIGGRGVKILIEEE